MMNNAAVVAGFFGAAASAPSVTHAARALDPLAASLRSNLLAPEADATPVPMLRAMTFPALTGGEGPGDMADRLRLRLDELRLAKRFGDAADVARMADLIVSELRQAAIASRKKVSRPAWSSEPRVG